MKKLAIALAMLLVFVSLTFAAEAENRQGGAEITYERAVKMAHYMHELAMGDYLDIKQIPDSMKNTVRDWAAGIRGEPRMIVQVNVNDASHLAEIRAVFMREPSIVSYEAQSSAIVEIWQMLAYYAGEEAALTESDFEQILTINGHLNASMLYADSGPEGNAMYIVFYEEAAPLMYLVCAENGAVSIQGMFLPSEKLAKCKNYGQVAMWLMLNGFPMTCSEVLPD